MRFEWDEEKRLINLAKHSIDFADVWQVFDNEIYTFIDDRFDYQETRFITYGLLQGKVVAIVHTEINEVIRIISLRRATKYEQIEYFTQIRN